MRIKNCPHCNKPVDDGYTKAINHLLTTKGISKYGLAKSLDVSRNAVYSWLNGDYRPTPVTLQKIKELYPDVPIKKDHEWTPEESQKTPHHSADNFRIDQQ